MVKPSNTQTDIIKPISHSLGIPSTLFNIFKKNELPLLDITSCNRSILKKVYLTLMITSLLSATPKMLWKAAKFLGEPLLTHKLSRRTREGILPYRTQAGASAPRTCSTST